MSASDGPTVMRRQLGAELRKLREEAGVSMIRAAAALDCALSKMSHVETGRYGVRKPDLEVLLRLYGVFDRFDELDMVRQAGTKRGWWSTYKLPGWLADLVGLEDGARCERTVEIELVPALLQTADYAKAVHVMGPHSPPAVEIARRVAVRMQRQKRLIGPEPLEFSAVISEAALLRTAAHPSGLGAEQLLRLVSDAALPNVSLQVLPIRIGLHGSMAGSFTLLDFASGVALNAAYQEYAAGGHLVDDQDVVQLLSDLHDGLRSQALDANESLALIAELAQRAE